MHTLASRIPVVYFGQIGLSNSSLFQLVPGQLVEPPGFRLMLNKNSELSVIVVEYKVVTAGLGLWSLT